MSEFPQLEEIEYQQEFLRDWWSPRKLFRGGRRSGKTEMMISELWRFRNHNFDTVLLAPKAENIRRIKERYKERFGQRLLCDSYSMTGIENITRSSLRYDVVIADEMQHLSFEKLQQYILPLDPFFLRGAAAAEDVDMTQYLSDGDDDFFDAVYEAPVEI
jgi:hypothetical protein